ncbi:MAG: YfhO family protein [Bryobacterales bacterium]|nr:YfhO family protein [Bryobacterales bacterium]
MLRAWREGKAVSWWVEAGILFAAASYLIWPLFHLEFSDKWASIESTFIADARFLKDHWPHPLWQPLWYTGTRFDYIYPPALRYGTAALAKWVPDWSTARAYHFYVAVLYALGIAGVYVLSRTGGRSRKFAIVAALAVATVSPSFLVMEELRNDARGSYSEPQRLGALVRYGEGPHMSAVAMLGFALAFSMVALRTGRLRWITAAACASALVVAHNFYGATALAMLFPIVVWSWWVTHLENRIFFRAAVIAVFSYGLCAFWLVPSYLVVTMHNMRYVSERGNRWSLWLIVGLAILYMKLTEKWARGRRDRAWPVFLIGALGILFVNVIGNYFFQFRVIGEPGRMVPELDLLVILAGAELLRWIWDAGWSAWPRFRIPRRLAVALTVFLLFYSVRKYVRNSWSIYVPHEDYRTRVEYRITDWMAKNMPHARAYTTGSVRFWYNTWYDLAEMGGGSEQGLLNPAVQPSTWQLGGSEDAELGILWLQALGVDAAIIHDQTSQEVYKDVVHPGKFEGKMELAYNDGQGNFIYRTPRRYPAIARVVETARLESLPPLPEDTPKEQLRHLVDILEKGPDAPVETRWIGTEELHVRARMYAGHTLFVQVPYNDPWTATVDGKPVPVRKTHLNFMRIDVPEGDQEIRLVFEKPWENRIGQLVFAATVICLVLVCRRRESAW